MLETRQLRYFVAVAEELHFGRAAVRLGLSQPPLSQQIRKLEEQLGTRLLMRTSRSVSLTPAGKALLEEARQLVSQFDRLESRMKDFASGRVGSIIAGFVPISMDNRLATAIDAFRKSFPEVNLRLRDMETEMQLQALRKGVLELGIVQLMGHPLEGLEADPFHRERYLLALPMGHPLSSKDCIELEDLDGQGMVFFPRVSQPRLYDALLGALSRAGAGIHIVQETAGVPAAAALVAAGLGVALVSETFARFCPFPLEIRDLGEGLPPVEYSLAWRPGHLSPAAGKFCDGIRSVFLGSRPFDPA